MAPSALHAALAVTVLAAACMSGAAGAPNGKPFGTVPQTGVGKCTQPLPPTNQASRCGVDPDSRVDSGICCSGGRCCSYKGFCGGNDYLDSDPWCGEAHPGTGQWCQIQYGLCGPKAGSLDPCAGKNCNNGKCVNGACQCNAGWQGADCKQQVITDPCAGKNCNNGKCTNGACVCNLGYLAPDCIKSACDGKNCGQGSCKISASGSAECVCNQGWIGLDCSQNANPCAGKTCSGRGSTVPSADGKSCSCQCYAGYNGADCEFTIPPPTNPCQGITCSGKGTASPSPDGKSCSCSCCAGYSGANCENGGSCATLACKNGRCDMGQCVCWAGWAGILCDTPLQDPCMNVNCGANAVCTRGACQCVAGATGVPPNCQFAPPNPCAGVSCLNGGSCSPANGMCLCINGFTGSRCEIPPATPNKCLGVTCLNGGSCNPANGMCACINNFSGSRCEIPPPSIVVIDCKPGQSATGPCPPGTYSLGKMTGCQCRPCPSGFTSARGSADCSVSLCAPGTRGCVPCPDDPARMCKSSSNYSGGSNVRPTYR